MGEGSVPPWRVCVCVGGVVAASRTGRTTHCRAGHSDSSKGSWLLQGLTQSAALLCPDSINPSFRNFPPNQLSKHLNTNEPFGLGYSVEKQVAYEWVGQGLGRGGGGRSSLSRLRRLGQGKIPNNARMV